MLFRLKPFILSSLVFACSFNFPHAVADDVCSHDISGIKLGMTKMSAQNLLIEQGFHQNPPGGRASRSIVFTNEKPWPPKGITLTRAQLAIATRIQDPSAKQIYEKRAETNPSIKKILTEIANLHLPHKENSMAVIIHGVKDKADNTPIAGITVMYKFPLEVSAGRDLVYSQAHKSLNNAAWDKFCANINVSKQNNWRFTDKNATQNRACYHDPYVSPRIGDHFRITIAPLIRGDKRECNYSYTSGIRAAKEVLTR
jgi:hypothetical protein